MDRGRGILIGVGVTCAAAASEGLYDLHQAMPAKFTPSFAKNVIRRSVRTVLDKHPSDAEVMRLWHHFNDRCAYCNESIPPGSTQARLDHLVSGGTNHISNRVPACARCNDEEKREAPWEQFLE